MHQPGLSQPTLQITARPWWILITCFQRAPSVSLTTWIPAPHQPYEILTSTRKWINASWVSEGLETLKRQDLDFGVLQIPSKPLGEKKSLKGVLSFCKQILIQLLLPSCALNYAFHVLGCGCVCTMKRMKVKCLINQVIDGWRSKHAAAKKQYSNAQLGRKGGFSNSVSHRLLVIVLQIFVSKQEAPQRIKNVSNLSSAAVTMQRLGGCFFDRSSKLSDFTTKQEQFAWSLYRQRIWRKDYTGGELGKL